MHTKVCIRRLVSYKVCLCFIVNSLYCRAGYVSLFCRGKIFVDFVSFLSMIIYEYIHYHDV